MWEVVHQSATFLMCRLLDIKLLLIYLQNFLGKTPMNARKTKLGLYIYIRIYIYSQDPTWHWHSKQLPGWSANSFFYRSLMLIESKVWFVISIIFSADIFQGI